ncbi:hypothetical protein BDK51DRAFT_37991 [Blyttiomyces helicus]|uniref:Uncharacterized protein n=1 Tax=Blyttiomyces helicus TaxID=388810 RepID=A0A4P9VTW9_9FUNG|nr:hypothetical protein BDK51DRAFT_37991 [Blyttiomyces helicus]|eukprot:RKO82984.1 hypothetical protein BDK51DRAFT_37991 [Blyttiomyces helicus]
MDDLQSDIEGFSAAAVVLHTHLKPGVTLGRAYRGAGTSSQRTHPRDDLFRRLPIPAPAISLGAIVIAEIQTAIYDIAYMAPTVLATDVALALMRHRDRVLDAMNWRTHAHIGKVKRFLHGDIIGNALSEFELITGAGLLASNSGWPPRSRCPPQAYSYSRSPYGGAGCKIGLALLLDHHVDEIRTLLEEMRGWRDLLLGGVDCKSGIKRIIGDWIVDVEGYETEIFLKMFEGLAVLDAEAYDAWAKQTLVRLLSALPRGEHANHGRCFRSDLQTHCLLNSCGRATPERPHHIADTDHISFDCRPSEVSDIDFARKLRNIDSALGGPGITAPGSNVSEDMQTMATESEFDLLSSFSTILTFIALHPELHNCAPLLAFLESEESTALRGRVTGPARPLAGVGGGLVIYEKGGTGNAAGSSSAPQSGAGSSVFRSLSNPL